MDVARLSFQERLGETFRRTLPKLGSEARAQLEAVINPQSLAIIAGVLVAWIVSHAFGIGEIIDILIWSSESPRSDSRSSPGWIISTILPSARIGRIPRVVWP